MIPFLHAVSRFALRQNSAWHCVAVLLLASGFLHGERAVGQSNQVPPGEVADFLVTERPVGRTGGRLVLALRAEPKTLNPLIVATNPSRTVVRRMMADLVHINRVSQETEPALAKSWTISDDARRFTLKLRRGLRFSDGHPFDADDVLFTFKVYLDEKIGSTNRDLLHVDGEPIKLKKLDSHTVEFEMPEPYAVGERLFDSIAILPRHELEESYKQGKIAERWSVTTPAGEIVGLGPFRLKEYVPGVRCVLERNPYFWKLDRDGARLPYLDEITFLFVPSDDAQVLRFQARDTDIIDHLSAENFSILERQARGASVRMMDLGPGLTYYFLLFNMNSLVPGELPEIAAKQRWFRQLEFRRAVSSVIDRRSIVKLVFRDKATELWSNVTPGNKRWLNAKLSAPRSSSVADARRLLQSVGFSWRSDKQLVDPGGKEVGFSILTSSSNSQRLRIATIIQDDLKKLGIAVRVVPLEFGALAERVTRSFEYEASVLALSGGDADPNAQMPVLLSSGNLHFWNLGQKEPSTPWEAEIDRLMMSQAVTLDFNQRKKIYDSVQELMLENLPLVFLVSPHVLVGSKSKVGNFQPAILDHTTLWNAEELFWQE